MKQILLVLFMAVVVSVNAQVDSTKKQIAVLIGGSFGGGVSKVLGTSNYNYDVMLREEPFYLTYTAYCSVLFKEKIGFRITTGRLGGSNASSTTVADYALTRFPDYHYLPEYSELHAGFHYMYVAPEFTYRVGSEPFNATYCLGAGMGSLHTPHGVAVLQKNGSNDFIELEYHSSNVMNYHVQADMEYAYMRQLSQHVFANVGLYVSAVYIFTGYEYHITEKMYGQPSYSLRDGGYRTDFLLNYNAGLFLNFQWNKRESERAIYE